ncbi:hypothetical protein SDC9_173321 [bioreactor metagenome]|uniref:Uncharacterized protein n=1 Tax=bioreactor metagenome TaxID=1076179 RepID=A0A645GIA1_9ZZZZ
MTMAVQGLNICERSRQKIKYRDFTSTSFIHYRDSNTISKRRKTIHDHNIYVFDISTFMDGVIGHVIMYLVNKNIIANGTVVQTAVINS